MKKIDIKQTVDGEEASVVNTMTRLQHAMTAGDRAGFDAVIGPLCEAASTPADIVEEMRIAADGFFRALKRRDRHGVWRANQAINKAWDRFEQAAWDTVRRELGDAVADSAQREVVSMKGRIENEHGERMSAENQRALEQTIASPPKGQA